MAHHRGVATGVKSFVKLACVTKAWVILTPPLSSYRQALEHDPRYTYQWEELRFICGEKTGMRR